MSSLFSGPGCFFLGILAFVVFGFQRGWRRELISLVFILLASVLVHADTSNAVSTFLGRIPAGLSYLLGLSTTPSSQPLSFIGGAIWSLIIFGALIVLGYFIGNRVFPKPASTPERIIGIIPGLISGAIVLGYLKGFIQDQSKTSQVSFDLTSADPGNYVPVIFVIAILALVIAVIAARAKKAPAKK